jgi:hypothetical protein
MIDDIDDKRYSNLPPGDISNASRIPYTSRLSSSTSSSRRQTTLPPNMSAPKHAAAGSPPVSPSVRIITHMNADHADSLVRYLEHYHQLSSFSARNAHITDITLSTLILSTRAAPRQPPSAGEDQAGRKTELTADTYIIPLDPPLTSWAQARERLVKMDEECVTGLGRSKVTLKTYLPPTNTLHRTMGVLTCLTLLAFCWRPNLTPNTFSMLFGPLPQIFPGWFSFCYTIQPFVFWGMVLIHGAEAWYLDRTRLSRHSVPRGSVLWCTWMVSAILEGFGNFQRVDEWVHEEEMRKARQKH